MKRFCGMMPSEEISIEKYYEDRHGLKIIIQAGMHGYTIIYADLSSEYSDIDSTSDKNFKTAYDKVVSKLGDLIEIKKDKGER